MIALMTEQQPTTGHDHTYSDDEWNAWNDYADQVGVLIKFRSWAGADDNDQAWYVESDGAAWSKDWLTRQLVDLAGTDAENRRGDYFLDTRDSKTEWGASVAVFEAVLTLSESLLTEAMSAAVGALAHRLATRMKAKFGGGQPLTEGQARASAENTVARVKGLPHDALELRSLEFVDDQVALVELLDRSSGRRYTVEVTGHSDSVRASRIRKVVQPDNASQPGSAPKPPSAESDPATE